MALKNIVFPLLISSVLCTTAPAWSTEAAPQDHITTSPSPIKSIEPAQETLSAPTTPSTVYTRIHEISNRASNLVSKAVDFLGIRYKRGGSDVSQGLDCSGLVKLVFKDALNIDLPRTALEMSRSSEKIDPSELQPGDLVFYNTMRRGFSHVGIYMGENKFIHSPSTGGQVRIESMNVSYWKKRFNGARRIKDEEYKDEERTN